MNVTFTGQVSSQVNAGETVTVTVTNPDGTTTALTGTTDSNGNFSISKDYQAGEYSAVAHVDADSEFTSADSTAAAFNVGLGQRSITLNVSVAS